MTARPPKITKFFVHVRPGFLQPGFLFGWLVNPQELRSSSADPIGIGSAKRRKAMFRNFKALLIALVVIAIAGSAYAFAAANTGVTASKAGEGSAAVTGYAVSSISYTLNADPTKLDAVVFTLDAAATNVQVQVVDGGTWYACSNTLFVWTCDTTVGTQATVATMDKLTVVASSR